jgi:hypothetical protein
MAHGLSRLFQLFASFSITRAVLFLLTTSCLLFLVYAPLYNLIYRGWPERLFVAAALISLVFFVSAAWVVLFSTIGRRYHWSPGTVRLAPCITALGFAAGAFLLYDPGHLSVPVHLTVVFFAITTSLANHGRKLAYPDLDVRDRDPVDIIRLFPKRKT